VRHVLLILCLALAPMLSAPAWAARITAIESQPGRVIITADGPMMNLPEWIADPRRHVIELLQCLIIGPPLDRLWFGVYSQVDDSVGSFAQLLHLLIPVVQ
jgi:hypothetical protein